MKLRSYFRAESEKVLLKDDDDTFGSDHHDIMKTFERVGWIEDDMLGVDSISIGLDNSMKHDGDEECIHGTRHDKGGGGLWVYFGFTLWVYN